jgi:hypothetical protein
MPRGQPDWGEYSPQEEVSKSLDLAELAARLGSPVIYDRNGTVLFIDTFQYGLIHWYVKTQAECTISACNTKALMGSNSLKFAFSGISSNTSYIEVAPPFRYLNRVGFEITPLWDNPDIALTLTALLFYQSQYHDFEIRITPALQKLEVLTATGWATVLDNLFMNTFHDHWHFLKLVVNIEPAKYVCLKINDMTIDLSAYTHQTSGVIPPNQLYFYIDVANTGANPGNLYVGSTVLSINEP